METGTDFEPNGSSIRGLKTKRLSHSSLSLRRLTESGLNLKEDRNDLQIGEVSFDVFKYDLAWQMSKTKLQSPEGIKKA